MRGAGGTALVETSSQVALLIPESQYVVIGRQEGGQIEYLDPRFRPTQVVPQTGQPVVTQLGDGADRFVSRGHFTLGARAGGLVLLNGVPRRGGGVRPPKNGTVLLSPEHRYLAPGEEFVIAPGEMARIRLPNSTVISIHAT
jgi:hypothetical protein